MSNLVGGRFRVLNTELEIIPGNPHMLHVATIGWGLRMFIVMLDIWNSRRRIYIEELVTESFDFTKDIWGHFRFIDDDQLAWDLAKFSEEKGFLDMKKLEEKIIERTNL